MSEESSTSSSSSSSALPLYSQPPPATRRSETGLPRFSEGSSSSSTTRPFALAGTSTRQEKFESLDELLGQTETMKDQLYSSKLSNDSLLDFKKSHSLNKSTPATALTELNELEERVKNWCDQAEVRFIPNSSLSTRLTAKELDNIKFYLDSNTQTAMRELQVYAAENLRFHPEMSYADWILTVDNNRPVLDSYRSLVSAKVTKARASMQLKQQNRSKKEELMELVATREQVWIADMLKD